MISRFIDFFWRSFNFLNFIISMVLALMNGVSFYRILESSALTALVSIVTYNICSELISILGWAIRDALWKYSPRTYDFSDSFKREGYHLRLIGVNPEKPHVRAYYLMHDDTATARLLIDSEKLVLFRVECYYTDAEDYIKTITCYEYSNNYQCLGYVNGLGIKNLIAPTYVVNSLSKLLALDYIQTGLGATNLDYDS